MASVADQSHLKEHIIQDNRSGLNIELLLKGHPYARIFEEADDGMYDAVNKGLLKATGDIICYLNCDEQLLPGSLSKVVAYFQQNPQCDVLFGDMIAGYDNGSPASYKRTLVPTRWHTRLCALSIFTCATFLRRTVVEEGLLFDPRYRIIGDSVWIDKLLSARKRLHKLDIPLAFFTITSTNLGSNSKRREEEKRWRLAFAPPMMLRFRKLVLAKYAFRKLLRGGFSKRDVDYHIFTMQSHGIRQRFVKANLQWQWVFSRLEPRIQAQADPRTKVIERVAPSA